MQQLIGMVLAAPLLMFALAAAAAEPGPIPVEVVEKDGAFRLLRGGEPYVIRGAGVELADVAYLTAHGGNSTRNWSTLYADHQMQQALEYGVTVLMCIDMKRERHGFDYDDEEAVAAQFEHIRGEVMKYKDHPALLGWIIGNEMNLQFTNPKVFDAINDISKMIHVVDGKHPTTTALAGFNAELVELVTTRAPDLDFISTQMYGDIVNLPRYLDETGYDGPLMVTEWGAIGHWEVGKTAWGAPIEQNSSDKAANYLKSHEIAIASRPDQVIGSYVFFWGQKQERTPTWYGMLLEDGSKTETIDVMHHLWTGQWPENRAPRVQRIELAGKTAQENVTLAPGQRVDAHVASDDPEGDALTYQWSVMRESEATQSGGDREDVPDVVEGTVTDEGDGSATLIAPQDPGAYRLFVYVHDGRGNAGHANLPFLVK